MEANIEDMKVTLDDFVEIYSKTRLDKIKEEYNEFKNKEKEYKRITEIIKSVGDYLLCIDACRGAFENNTCSLDACIYVVADNAEKCHFKECGWFLPEPREVLTVDECTKCRLIGKNIYIQFSVNAMRKLLYYAVKAGELEMELQKVYEYCE